MIYCSTDIVADSMFIFFVIAVLQLSHELLTETRALDVKVCVVVETTEFSDVQEQRKRYKRVSCVILSKDA